MDLRKPDGVTIIGVVILLALVGFIVKDFVFSPVPSSLNAPANGLGAGVDGSPGVEEAEEVAVPQNAFPSGQQIDVQPPADGTGLLSAYAQEKRVVPGGVRVSESIGDYN